MNHHKKIVYVLFGMLGILAAMMIVTGCATVPQNEALVRAKAAYEQAQANPDVSAHASVALYEAEQALKKAEQAKDVEEVNHLAHRAERKSQIALALSEQKVAEKKRAALSEEKDKIVLQARELETKRALRLAEARGYEAEQARKEAEARALEIERVKGESQALAQQIEKARKEADARVIEIERARQEAEVLTQQVEQARKEAEARALEIERAKGEAQALAQQTEKAKKESELRALEIERAKVEAQALTQQTEKAKKESELRALEIERAKAEAEAKALEAEKARKEAEANTLALEKAKKEAEAKALEAETARVKVEKTLAQRKQLEKEIAELKAQQTERGIILTLGDILFASGKSDMKPGAMRAIDQLVDFLKKYPARNVLVEGHTDSVGSSIYNLGLSQRRADTVKAALIASGIDSARIMIKGYGESYPVTSNDTPAGRQRNRRVEVVITEEGINPEKVLR